VHLGPPNEIEGFAISVDIKVEGVEDEKIIQAAHEVCPSTLHRRRLADSVF
jgi:organic hydroperoxide reductase OsmC/OhrA